MKEVANRPTKIKVVTTFSGQAVDTVHELIDYYGCDGPSQLLTYGLQRLVQDMEKAKLKEMALLNRWWYLFQRWRASRKSPANDNHPGVSHA